MTIQTKFGNWRAVCDACGYRSRTKRKNRKDIPRDWTGSLRYLRCLKCTTDYYDALGEMDAAWSGGSR